jgi:hypothetical protein
MRSSGIAFEEQVAATSNIRSNRSKPKRVHALQVESKNSNAPRGSPVQVPIKTHATVAKTREQGFMSGVADVLAVIVGIGTEFTVHLVGELYISEILLLLVFPFLLVLRGKRALRPELKTIYSLMGLWLIGLAVSDAYNHIDTYDRMRGAAIIVFFAINLLCMSMLLGGNKRRMMIYFIGLIVGSLASCKLQPSPAFDDYPWKFGYSFGTIQLVMLTASYFYDRRRYGISTIFIFGICAVNLLVNYRSPVLDILVVFVLVYPVIPERMGGIQILPRSSVARLVVLAVLAVVAGQTAGAMVNFVTRAGLVNEEAQAKNEAQQKDGGLLLGGRPEFVIGLRAALERPIIGHGSWAKDYKYLEMLQDMEVETGTLDYSGDFEAGTNGLIPAHSGIVTAWIWAGIAGLIFWVYMAWYILNAISRVAIIRPPLAPFYMWFLISTWWDIFFSPFAANRRIIDAVLIVFVADLMKKKVSLVRGPWRRLGATNLRRPQGPGNQSFAPPRTL